MSNSAEEAIRASNDDSKWPRAERRGRRKPKDDILCVLIKIVVVVGWVA